MNLDEFSQQIARMVARTESLRAQARLEPERDRLFHEAIEELRTGIEELHVAEEELREQNAMCVRANVELELERRRYRDLFAGAPIGYVVTGVDGSIVGLNVAASRLLGAEPGAPRAVPLIMFVAAADRLRWSALLERAREGDDPGAEVVTMRTFGAERWFPARVHVAIERDDAGEVSGHRWILEDATETRQAQQAERLVEESKRKDEFLAMLAHELRNPLAPIQSAVELWRHHAHNLTIEQSRWSVEVVARQTDHLSHLVDDLLDVSRVSHGKIRLRREPLDLRDVAEQAADVLRATALLHQLQLEVEREALWVEGDPTRLRQIVVNLVDNAIKYTPKGRTIRVRVRAEDGLAVLEVVDEGVGMEPEMLESVFGLFNQGEQTLARSQGGLGLGLALVRRLVELHGGTVEARSDGLGKGSRFIVRLPRCGAPERPASACDSQIGMGGARKLLVVDDNVDAAEMLATLLEAEGHTVSIAYDGAGAMETFEVARPDTVLLDLGLPDIDGLQVARHLRARAPGVVLVAITGYGDEDMRGQTRDARFDHHLLKPVDFDALRGLLAAPVPRESTGQ